ncbi:probable ATP-dependent DNA helicase HFM1 isoform X1 [Mauremys mutica]|uniref:probable ATP-dependent DNA helicase HFM1 isoform X1 n=2 Tax=Mauremys mutica TaxID=74926 RepID=UPI001D1624D8|nr:probable ATP-dependent DNA helicase HFM1 isoform X1 [Mauremys mutica]XP_044884214.1 probable ATP-dependent DNA helicase HFM1 isoform X1 [Mauremys mutica]XP_044884215.1 probable ATP-dependent DNA helicase HFM1 isoform X1 [Mauremys mutica]XP_044884216.1 probable ATP-dependent DNA helicase HFM1 isoform X1 [Mauremys mutica]
MLKPTATAFSLDNLFFERPDASQNRYLEHEEPKNWYLAPAPSVTGIPATQELQKELEKNNCLDGKEAKVQSFPDASKSFGMEGTVKKDLGFLRAVTEIPAQFRNIFKEFPYFNYIQSKALDDILYTDRNFVICAPTGSGKTVMFELAITRLLMEVPMPWLNIKIVYMAPIKALCSQRFDDWKDKFGPIGLSCKELTGDTVMDDLFEIQHAHIITTTPEKWDSMTRKWRDNSLVQLVRLFLIDEVHVVKDESRGATLEVVVSRMKTIQSSLSRISENPATLTPMRFVAVSATIPNAEDIAEWLSDGMRPAVCLKIDESHRPVKLRKIVLGFPCSSNQTEFKFDLTLNYKVASVIQTYSEQKPTLVFCATRKGVQQAASVLAKDAKFIMTVEQKQRLQKCANSTKDTKVRDLLMCGVAYHHAGMELSDRKIIEGAFTRGDLPVLFTTSTLAMGVNLPAHLVVIKSTMHYVGGMFQEYSETDILQMIGRAGRPQFDTTATAVILTRLSTREKYVQLLNGADTIESSLHKHLVEHLNAEIVLHTITDVKIALEWIRSTFLYIRVLKNPVHYGFSSGLDTVGIEAKLQELCLKNLNDLSSLDLIKMDEEFNFKPTETGKLMAWYYIAFDTVKQFSSINGKETLSELITMISGCVEFSDVKLRINEKKILNTLNKDKNRITIRFPMEGKIKTREMKVNCLIQAQLGCIPIQDFTLTQDIGKIFRHGLRVTKWLSDFLASRKNNFPALLNSLILAKCFRCKLWENSLHVSKQLEKIGVTLSNAMVNAGLTSFKKIEDANARELELILNRHPPFGNQIKESVLHLPKYELDIEQLAKYSDTVAEILVTIILTNFEQLQIKRTAPDFHYVTLIIGDADNQVVFKQKIMDSVLLKNGNWTKKIEVKRALKSEELSINLISSEYVGVDIQQTYTAFYLGPKRFGNEVVLQRKLEAESSPMYHASSIRSAAARKNTGGACNREITYMKLGNRECSHHCKNKDVCGHDCCKVGVSQKSELKKDSKFSSYLADLRNRNSISSVPPVKRLKMQIQLNKSPNVDLKQFVFTPKSLLPALPRCDYAQSSGSASQEHWNNVNILGRPQNQLQSESYEKSNFSWEHSVTVSEESHQMMTSKKNLKESLMHNFTNADKSSSWFSEALNVNFELGDEVWDDFDDDKLIHASSFLTSVESREDLESGNTCLQSTIECKPLFQNSENKVTSDISKNFCMSRDKSGVHLQNSAFSTLNAPSEKKLSVQYENTSTFSFQKRKHPNPLQELKNREFSRNSEIISGSSQFIGKENFFICNKERKKEIDVRYLSDDETNDIKPFLGIFDGIF